jgi:hypothetical protein
MKCNVWSSAVRYDIYIYIYIYIIRRLKVNYTRQRRLIQTNRHRGAE